jgi:Arc/MetJ family transcription regulator
MVVCSIMCSMATNLDLDPALINEAVAISGCSTKKEAVTRALEEFIARRRQARMSRLFGTIDYDPKYNYKKQRSRR